MGFRNPFPRGGPPGRTQGQEPDVPTGAAAASPPDPPRIVSGKALHDAPPLLRNRGEGVNGGGFRTGTLVVLGVLAVALLGPVVWWSRRPAGGEMPRLVPVGADVVALELRVGEPVRLERAARRAGGDDWRIAGAGGGPADPAVVDAMLAALETARPARAIRLEDPAAPPARLGLAPPRGAVRLWAADGTTWTVEFGAPVPGEPRLHVRSSLEPGLVWIVEDALRRSVARAPAELRDRRLWTLPAARVSAVEWRDGETAVRVERTLEGFRVTPPGAAADPERAGRLFDLAAAPRASGFRDSGACGGVAAGPRLIVEAPGERHELVWAGGADGTSDTVACVDGRTGVTVEGDLRETPRALVPLLARTSLFGAFDAEEVTSVAVEEPGGRWSLRRGAAGWEAEGLGFAVDPTAASGWLRRLLLVAADPARPAGEPFVAAGAVELSVRGRTTVRVERSAPGPDGAVAVRRAGETAAFRLTPQESYLLVSPQAHLASAGAACDPLAAVRLEVRERGADGATGRPVQVLARAPGAGWAFEGSRWPVDAAGVDLLLGELCRLPLQPRVGPAPASGAGWSVRVVGRDGAELVSGAAAEDAARGLPVVVLAGEADGRGMSEAGWRRLTRPLVAAEALALRPGEGAAIAVQRADGRRLVLTWDGTAWVSPKLPGTVAASVGTTVAAPAWRGALSLAAPDESAGWPVWYRVERRAAGDAALEEWRVGGPDAAGRLLLQEVATGALFEIDPALPGVLELALRLAGG